MILIEANFYKHNRVHLLFLLQKHNFSVIWAVRLDAQTRVLMEQEEHSPCLPLRPTQWGFQLIPQSVKCSWRKGGVYTWSEHWIQLWIFPVELYVFEVGQLIAASVLVLGPHTGEYFFSHWKCSLLVGSYWKSRQVIVQEILPLREQQLPGS